MQSLSTVALAVFATLIQIAQPLAADIRLSLPTGAGPAVITLNGPITRGDLFNTQEAIDEANRRRPRGGVLMILNSPGGDHFEGVRTALLLKRKGVATAVLPRAICMSACSSMFFGGFDKSGKPNRTAYEGARIGVHRMSPTNGRVPAHVNDRVNGGAEWFLNEMKVAKGVRDKFFETGPRDIHVLTAAEMLESGIFVRGAHLAPAGLAASSSAATGPREAPRGMQARDGVSSR